MTHKIAMIGACPYPVPQGSQVLLRNTARALRDLGHDVHLFVYSYGFGLDDGDLPLHRCRHVPGANQWRSGFSWAKPLLDLSLFFTLRECQERFDVFHVHNYEALIIALRAQRRPIVYHAHNAMADELPHFIPASQPVGDWLDRTFPRQADQIIAPHEPLAEYLVRCGCDPDRITIIPPSVEVRAFSPDDVHDRLPPVLYMGNLDRYQNIDFLLRVMEHVRKQVPAARLLIATAQQADIPRATTFFIPDFNAVRAALAPDAVVACPRVSWSGYPMKLLNAMAAGKAIVACKSAAHPLTHEHNGLVVADNHERGFADALVRLLDDVKLRAHLGRNARQTALENHAPEQIAARIETVYEKVLGPPQTPVSRASIPPKG